MHRWIQSSMDRKNPYVGRTETCTGVLGLARTLGMHPQLAAHFAKERSSETTAQRDFGAVYQFHDVVAMKERM
jgi:hypothetical protein